MKIFGSFFLLTTVFSIFTLQSAIAQNTPVKNQPKWIYPVIKNIGGVHPRPNLPVRPDPAKNYNIFVDLVSTRMDSTGHLMSLDRLARLVNLMAYTKVPASHVHIVALFDGKSGFAAANNSIFSKHFKEDNPNLKTIQVIKKAGVKFLVCSQALAELHLPDNAVTSDVNITLSALTDAVVYGQKGYIYMQL